MLEGLVAEIELRHGVAVESSAAVGPRRGQRVHVLDPYWTRHRGWAAEELAGRRLPASPEQLEEEERDNAYDKAGFLSFMGYGGADLRQVEILSGGRGRHGHVAFAARACRLACPCVADVPCTWVRCCLVFSVLFGNTTYTTSSRVVTGP